MDGKKFYITTPIYYVNDKPHIGHAYTTIMADVYARFYRLQFGKSSVFFLTGTDEHGTKVLESAKKKKIPTKEFVDEMSSRYKDVWERLNIGYDKFFRTTDPKHKIVVQQLLSKIYDRGLIYKDTYKGKYCVGCEKFLSRDEIVNSVCVFHPNLKVLEQEEENYFLKLGKLSKDVVKELEKGTYAILPIERKNEILGKIEQGIDDVSISRVGMDWGIKIPWDPKHTVYVWVDALINYYSATQIYSNKKKFWPPTLHLMAKDILWFHSLIWEGLLLAANLSLPKTIFAHGFFTIDGQKMSKSLGNVIDPTRLVDIYGVDGVRYLLITSFQFGKDGDISLSRFKEIYNSDLANGIGNIVSRIAKLAEKLSKNPVETKSKLSFSDQKIIDFFESNKPDEALRYIWSKISKLDKKIAIDKPWEITSIESLSILLKEYIEEMIRIGTALEPFLPETSKKILSIFTADIISKPEPLFLRK